MEQGELVNRIIDGYVMEEPVHNSWLININDLYNYYDEIKKYLILSDIEKSKKIVNNDAKKLFCLRKGITRIIVSRFLNIYPNELIYEYDCNGKPYIKNKGLEHFGFNISHSKELLFIGVVERKDIGVDVEKINLNKNHLLLSKSVFSEKEMDLYESYDEANQLRCFYKVWVQKEAVSKAVGLGISMGFDTFDVSTNPYKNEDNNVVYLNSLHKSINVRVKFKGSYVFASAIV